ncbi:gluconokinase [Actinomadura macrotermitis]|uniref:Gluconokinase n=1 Tax=Actinomadura macrotermitis TaxID=2585200 RepID=A0A7K0C101_9ACTN|nr:gluconokinase [Actinomadura macrotermitis]MQY06752.1 Gluconokinase [Actinomadura macrotermitis]
MADEATVVLVMGVSGSGKTTVGRLLAERLGWAYAEADEFHSPENIAKMREGVPLTDADRAPWLRAIAEWIADRTSPGVVSCSALKRSYRDMMRGVRLVYLDGDRELIATRIKARTGHFFRPEMLDSQFADLQPPAPDEHALYIPVSDSPERIVDEIVDRLGLVPDQR